MTMSVSPKQASGLVLSALKVGLVPMLHGSPGTAKSSIINDLAKDLNLKVIDLRLSQMGPEDLAGLPYFNEDHTKSDFIPPADAVKEQDLKNIRESIEYLYKKMGFSVSFN